MLRSGEVISYLDMCRAEGVNLQRGMNFRLNGGDSVILMSLRHNAPYADRVEDNGRTLIYEGHDVPRVGGIRDPKRLDQPMRNPGGSLTQNGRFYEAAKKHREPFAQAELVKVYEKIHSGIWVFNGMFRLIDAWLEDSEGRKVFKFRLAMADDVPATPARTATTAQDRNLEHGRMIPSAVKREVWKRDKGRCVECGATDNLHFDHIIPYSRGGTSLKAENIQLLCARHNLEKRDRIQ